MGLHAAGGSGMPFASCGEARVPETLLGWSVVPSGGIDPATFLVLGGLAAMIVGATKAGFAGGVGLLSTPMMIYACGGDARLAAAILLPLLIACDYVTLLLWWRRWDLPNVLLLLPGMTAGIALGGGLLWMFLRLGGGRGSPASQQVTNAALSCTIGLLAVGFVVMRAVRLLRGRAAAFRPNSWHGFLAGSAAGVTSTLAHAAGPITTMFLLPQQMPKGRFVATAALYYWIGNQVKLAPYLLLGMLDAPSLSADLALLPAVVGGALLGVFLHRRINERWFSAIVYALLAVIGAHMSVTNAWRLAGLAGARP
jgi:hypothetical protein